MHESIRGEWVVWLLVVAGLAVVEIGLAFARPVLSGDIRHLDEAPQIAERLHERSDLRVLIGGNSLIGEGLDPSLLDSLLSRDLGREVHGAMVRPDATGPLEWDYLFRKLVFNPGFVPDVLVLGFGPGHLRDRPASSAYLRLAVHHVDGSDIGRLWTEELHDFESRVGFFLARISMTFGLRDRISSRILATVVPGYRDRAAILLITQPGAGSASAPTYQHLVALLDEAGRWDLPVVLVPVPQPAPYPVEQEVLRIAAARNVAVLDVRPVEGLSVASFPDGKHLSAQGRRTFTRWLAGPLAQSLPESLRND